MKIPKTFKNKILITVTILMGYIFLVGVFLLLSSFCNVGNNDIKGFIMVTVSLSWLVPFFTENVNSFV